MADRMTCPRCGGKLGAKKRDRAEKGSYKRCLDCGFRYRCK